MTKTTREIENQKNIITMWFAVIIATMIAVIIGLIIYDLLDDKISQLPHKYCHNETIINPEYEKYLSKSEYDILFNLTLSERMELTCNKQCLYEQLDSAIGSFYSSYTICFAICVQKSFYLSKEVCEIR